MCIRRLASNLQPVIVESYNSTITDEWKLYAVDAIPVEWYSIKKSSGDMDDGESDDREEEDQTEVKLEQSRIDHCWTKVLGRRNAQCLICKANNPSLARHKTDKGGRFLNPLFSVMES